MDLHISLVRKELQNIQRIAYYSAQFSIERVWEDLIARLLPNSQTLTSVLDLAKPWGFELPQPKGAARHNPAPKKGWKSAPPAIKVMCGMAAPSARVVQQWLLEAQGAVGGAHNPINGIPEGPNVQHGAQQGAQEEQGANGGGEFNDICGLKNIPPFEVKPPIAYRNTDIDLFVKRSFGEAALQDPSEYWSQSTASDSNTRVLGRNSNTSVYEGCKKIRLDSPNDSFDSQS